MKRVKSEFGRKFSRIIIGGSAWESNPPAALSDGTPDLKPPRWIRFA